jgi:hypothetical protein
MVLPMPDGLLKTILRFSDDSCQTVFPDAAVIYWRSNRSPKSSSRPATQPPLDTGQRLAEKAPESRKCLCGDTEWIVDPEAIHPDV